MAKQLITLEKLQNVKADWLAREGLGTEADHHAWLEEGIRIYEQFVSLDHRNASYKVMLSNLYLEWGVDEKIIKRNRKQAHHMLRYAASLSPDHPDACYHLAFMLAEEHKWESVLFYAKEALENGLSREKQIKLLCNMALAYARLDFHHKSQKSLIQAVQLDENRRYEWLIALYQDRRKTTKREPLLLKAPDQERKAVTMQVHEQLKQQALKGQCMLLDLSSLDTCVYTASGVVRLERKEAEMLGYLMDQWQQPCSRKEIKEVVWPEREIGETAIEHYLSKLTEKLAKALDHPHIKDTVLVTSGRIYQWKLDIEQYVIR